MGDEAWGMGEGGWTGVGEPGGVRSYEDLRVWRAGIDFAEAVYITTRDFPGEERFGLTSQLRRAAVSIPSNIAEGWGRGSKLDYLRFLRIARGSLFEVQTQLLIANRVGFLSASGLSDLRQTAGSLRRQLIALILSVERSEPA